MNDLEKKAIQHSVDVLKEVDQYKLYSLLKSSLEDQNIEQSLMRRILEDFQSNIQRTHSGKIKEVQGWLETLLK
jgi:hypothetical protein